MSEPKRYRPDEIPQVWNEVKPYIQAALEYSYTHTLGDIAEGLISGAMTLWTYGDIDAALVAQLFPDQGFCVILTLAGKGFDRYSQHLPVIEQWAKVNNCREMRIYGRRGWARMLKDYQEKYTVLGKTL